ncbi:MAG: hypothetical protein IKO85_00320 [Bacteroidaceae bacterium]|nr:hypothetical protein [Bacteroidaceae bacterium]
MKETSIQDSRLTRNVLITVFVVLIATLSTAFWFCYQTVKAEAYARYMGIKNVSAEKVSRVVRGVELSAQNVFDEVSANMDTPENVITALRRKANLNRDTRGYFAAFELDYFPEQGTWFEPYIYQPDVTGFEYRQVGSARHNYTKSPWYVQAKKTGETFWSEPYYYYDGTSMSGHYTTFIKPLYDGNGRLACVCGADMKFEWLAKELEWVDESSKHDQQLNKYQMMSKDLDFYSLILDIDGTSIAHPEELSFSITDHDALLNLAQKKGGELDMNVGGVPCTVYYGPIENIEWAIAVVVPKQDLLKPMLPLALVFVLLAAVGMLIVWLVTRTVAKKATSAMEN